MKNSPDHEWFDSLGKRLGDYTEMPDADMWDRISAGLPSRPAPVWIPWTLRTTAVLSLVIITLSLTDLIQPRPVSTDAGFLDDAPSHADSAPDENSQYTPPPADSIYPDPVSGESVVPALQGNRAHHFNLSARTRDESNSTAFSENKNLPQDSGVAMRDDGHASPETLSAVPVINTDSSAATDTAPVIIPARIKRKFHFYASLSASMGFQKITPIAGDGMVIESFYKKGILSQDRLGWGFQAGVQTRVGRKLEVFTGISLYRQSHNLVYQYYSDEITTHQDELFDYRIAPGIVRKSVNYDMLNAGAEAGLLYYLTGERLIHKFGAGLAWQHGTRKGTTEGTYDNAHSHYLLYQLLYRNEYVVNNRMNFFIQPFYRHVLVSNESLAEPFMVKPYHAGVSLGIVFRPN